MLVGLHVPTNFQIYRQTLTLSKCMCMRASGASELRKFWHFHILKLLFLSIFCRYIIYFVGTNEMLVGLHVPTNFQMYRQNSEKSTIGGGGGQLPPPPPAPPLATLMIIIHLGVWYTLIFVHISPPMFYPVLAWMLPVMFLVLWSPRLEFVDFGANLTDLIWGLFSTCFALYDVAAGSKHQRNFAGGHTIHPAASWYRIINVNQK